MTSSTQLPPHLSKGDTVYLLNISRKGVYDTNFITQIFEKWGLETIIGETINEEGYCQFSADETTRLRDFQTALDDPKVRAIFFCRGGYGTVQILDKIDFSEFVKHPKWLIGYSDITYLHAHVNRNFGIATLHGSLLFGFHTASVQDLASLENVLHGHRTPLVFDGLENHKIAAIQGELVGGNLSILHTVIGTGSDIITDGKILIIEDVFENLMSIERMLHALKRSGKFDKLKGILFGDFIIPIKDNERSNCIVGEIPCPDESSIQAAFRLMVLGFFKPYDFPICFGLPVGHNAQRNVALALGSKVALEMTDNTLELVYLEA